jgi:hypothetical protein
MERSLVAGLAAVHACSSRSERCSVFLIRVSDYIIESAVLGQMPRSEYYSIHYAQRLYVHHRM